MASNNEKVVRLVGAAFGLAVLVGAVTACDEEEPQGELRAIEVDLCPSACETVPGDVNGDGQADITDMQLIVRGYYYGDPVCEIAADVNGDGDYDISDIVYFSNWMWSGGEAPVDPVPQGDVDADGSVDITDMQLLPKYLYGDPGVEICEPAADVNGDCQVDISDVSYLSEFLWSGGEAPRECTE